MEYVLVVYTVFRNEKKDGKQADLSPFACCCLEHQIDAYTYMHAALFAIEAQSIVCRACHLLTISSKLNGHAVLLILG